MNHFMNESSFLGADSTFKDAIDIVKKYEYFLLMNYNRICWQKNYEHHLLLWPF